MQSRSEALAAEPDPHTTVADPEAALDVHVADSLSGLEVPELSRARRIADIGAGAGFPGLVLAIALPRAQVDLIESAGRKTAVIDRLIQAAELGERALHNRARGGLGAGAAGARGWARGLRRGDGPGGGAAGGAGGVRGAAAARGRGAGGVEGRARLGRGGRRRGCRGEGGHGGEGGAARCSRIAASENRHLHVYRKIAPTPAGFPRRAGDGAQAPAGAERRRALGRPQCSPHRTRTRNQPFAPEHLSDRSEP